MAKKLVNNRLEHYMKKKNIGVIDLATAVGVSKNSISSYKNKKTIPSVDIAVKISQFLEVDLHDLWDLPRTNPGELVRFMQ